MKLPIQLNSYKAVLLGAILVRLIAVIFSPGYGMHDDHFLIVEASSSWVDGYDYNRWLPWTPGSKQVPDGHSFTYVGLNYLYFGLMKYLGVIDPKILMLFNRLLHAAASLIIVWYGMKITEKLSDRKNAIIVGWLLAILWIMPFVSVRNLVEIAPMPFMMLGTWLMLREPEKRKFLVAGILFGLAVSFRYQIGVFAVGVAAYYFFSKEFRTFFLFCAGVLITFILTQGLVDFFIWGYPFAEFWGYVTYNMKEGTEYLKNTNYFMYFLVLMGCFFVPLGVLLMIGFLRSWRKWMILFVPTMLFILFHTLYPNRQERFVLTVLPYFIILGVMGYRLFRSKRATTWWNVSFGIFLFLNTIFLGFAITMYSKKSRVEAMYSLYGNNMEEERILLEGSVGGRTSMMPKFYAKSWHCSFVDRTDPKSHLKDNPKNQFDYIFFFDEKGLAQRIEQYRELYPRMTLVKKCDPSLIDRLLRQLNPRNANEYIEVWETHYREYGN
jgi:hypothetical protein